MEEEKKELPKKRWFGRGIYGSKDVPIRILDGLIAFLIVLTVALTAVFAINGGYVVSFDTDGGEVIESQKLRHGSFVSEDVTLTARWTPAKVTVRFDLDGGIWSEADQEKMRAGTAAGADSLEVTFGENYGVLPVPVKEGAVFDGWRYSGQNITEDTKVTVNGEHVLTAQWK